MAHCRLHRFGGLQYFGHDQFIRVEEPPDFRHSGHQRAVHDVEWSRSFRTLAFEIFDQPVARSFDDVITKALVEREVCGASFFFSLSDPEMLGDPRDMVLIDCRALLLGLFPPVCWDVSEQPNA